MSDQRQEVELTPQELVERVTAALQEAWRIHTEDGSIPECFAVPASGALLADFTKGTFAATVADELLALFVGEAQKVNTMTAEADCDELERLAYVAETADTLDQLGDAIDDVATPNLLRDAAAELRKLRGAARAALGATEGAEE